MSRESIFMTASTTSSKESVVRLHECFGWELFSISGDQIIMQRETQDSVYDQLLAYEKEYNAVYKQKLSTKEPDKPQKSKGLNIILCIVFFILLIVPFIIYLIKYFSIKKKYDEEMLQYEKDLANYKLTTKQLDDRLDFILTTSRHLFFSKRKIDEKVVVDTPVNSDDTAINNFVDENSVSTSASEE